jgi:hypothetical protein
MEYLRFLKGRLPARMGRLFRRPVSTTRCRTELEERCQTEEEWWRVGLRIEEAGERGQDGMVLLHAPRAVDLGSITF